MKQMHIIWFSDYF